MISRASAGGVFADRGALKARVIQEANAFAASKGKVAVAFGAHETHPAPGQMPAFEYQFRLMDKNDPRATGGLVPRADVVIERHDTIDANIKTVEQTDKKPDLYVELMKLDDLRKKGLITDAEFDAQKQKLLSQK